MTLFSREPPLLVPRSPQPARPLPITSVHTYEVCQACHHLEAYVDLIALLLPDGESVAACKYPAQCRQRAQLSGIWMRAEPPTWA
jgi:hypothetical protein